MQEITGSYAPGLMGLSGICLVGGTAILLMRERRGEHLRLAEKDATLDNAANPVT